MFVEHFIASRVSGSAEKKSFSTVIIRIAIATIALSISVMILSSSVIYGFKTKISEKIFDFWGHIQITELYSSGSALLETTPMDYDPALIDSMLDIDGIQYEWPLSILGRETGMHTVKETRGGVKSVYRFVQYPAVMTTREDMEGLVFKGLSDDFSGAFFARYLVAGETIDFGSTDPERKILVSQTTANRLDLSPGDAVLINFIKEQRPKPMRFEVAGIYKTGLAEYDRRLAFLDLEHLQEVLGWSENEVSGLEVVIDDIDDLSILGQYINGEILPHDLVTRSVRQVAANIFDWLELQNINEVIIMSLMLLVCIINMITALLILILERTHMIGVLKALGSANWQIRKIFIRQAGYILFYGLFIGNVVGLVLCMVQRYFQIVKLREEDYYLAFAPIEFNISMIVLVNLGTVVITMLFLIIPSYYISKVSPTKALRFN